MTGCDAIVWDRLVALREGHRPELIENARKILSESSPPPTEPRS